MFVLVISFSSVAGKIRTSGRENRVLGNNEIQSCFLSYSVVLLQRDLPYPFTGFGLFKC